MTMTASRILGLENTWGATDEEVASLSARTPFSGFLPWISFEPDEEAYVNSDDSLSFIWECIPLNFGSEQTVDRIQNLLQASYPENSMLQVILHSDDNIEPFLDSLKALNVRREEILHRSASETCEFLSAGRKGLKQIAGTPVRNFRLIVCLKLPPSSIHALTREVWQNLRMTVEELLNGCGVHPRRMSPDRLLGWLRTIFNDNVPKTARFSYDDNRPINKQIIRAENSLEDLHGCLRFGDRHFMAASPRACPKNVDFLQTNELFGGIWGIRSDSLQIRSSFLYSISYVFQDLRTALSAKCNLVLNQRGVGSLAPSLARKQEEYLKTMDALDHNVQYIKVLPVLWVWSSDKESANESLIRAMALWEEKGYLMQRESMMAKVLLITSMPGGLSVSRTLLDTMERDFILDAPAAARLCPMQADFRGGGKPVLVFVGRKGQLVTFDIFEKAGGTNYNGFIVAASGTGKSFVANCICSRYYAAGAKIRVIDVGRSYLKMTAMLGARFLEFDPHSDVCLNPFSSIYGETKDDISASLRAVTAIIAQMTVSSTPGETPSAVQISLIKSAVRWAWDTKNRAASVDDVYRYLVEFPKHATKDTSEIADASSELVSIARMLSLTLNDFISSGSYGRFFNGPATFDITKDEFVVLELGHLKQLSDLFRVVMLQIINAVTQDLYLGDRMRNTLILLDEAWQFLGEGGSATLLKEIIETGYRMARKFNGSFTVISQSLLDLQAWGEVGKVIQNNSAFKVLLESSDFDIAKRAGFLDVGDFEMRLLRSVKSNRPKYSEMYLQSSHGSGVMRFLVDRFNYYAYTSDAEEVAQIENLIGHGMSYPEAIDEMVRKNSG